MQFESSVAFYCHRLLFTIVTDIFQNRANKMVFNSIHTIHTIEAIETQFHSWLWPLLLTSPDFHHFFLFLGDGPYPNSRQLKKGCMIRQSIWGFFQYSWVKSALPTQTIDLVSPLILQLIDVMYFWDSLSLYSMCSNWRCSSSASAGTGSDTGLFIVQWPIASRTWRLEI